MTDGVLLSQLGTVQALANADYFPVSQNISGSEATKAAQMSQLPTYLNGKVTPPVATTSVLGGVIAPTSGGLTIDGSGNLGVNWGSPGPIGGTTPASGAFTVLTTTRTGNFLASQGANINRMADRVFVGAAVEGNGNNPDTGDWLDALIPNSSSVGQAVVLATNAYTPLVTGTRSSDRGSATFPQDSFGTASFAINDGTTVTNGQSMWAVYGEARHYSGLPSGAQTLGCELDVIPLSGANTGTITPYSMYANLATANLWLSSGRPDVSGANVTAAMGIINNAGTQTGGQFTKGIVIDANAIVGSISGTIGSAPAIVMANGHEMQWMDSGGNVAGAIANTNTAGTEVKLLMDSTPGVRLQYGGKDQVIVGPMTNASDVYSVILEPGAAGVSSPGITAGGTDANINLNVVAKGAGAVIVTGNAICPGTNNTIYCGLGTNQWSTVYAVNGVFSGSLTATNGNAIQVAASGATAARTIASKLADAPSVVDFGADPTGVADSTSAFNTAMTDFTRLYVPPGTYKVTNTLTLGNNVALIGPESRSAVITPYGDFHLFSIAGSNVSLQNFEVDNTHKTGGYDIILSCGSTILNHIYIRNIISVNNGYGFLIDAGAGSTGYYENLTVEECQAFGCQGEGISMTRGFAFLFFRKVAISFVGQANSNYAGFAADFASMTSIGAAGGLLLEDVDIEGTSGTNLGGITSWPAQQGFYFNEVTELWIRRCEADTMDANGFAFSSCNWAPQQHTYRAVQQLRRKSHQHDKR
jgi:hypothetical protein